MPAEKRIVAPGCRAKALQAALSLYGARHSRDLRRAILHEVDEFLQLAGVQKLLTRSEERQVRLGGH